MERYTLTQRFTEERVLALTEQRTILLAEAAEEKNAALLEQRAILESAAAEDKAAALKELKFLLESVAAEDKARALAAQRSALEAAAAKAQARPARRFGPGTYFAPARLGVGGSLAGGSLRGGTPGASRPRPHGDRRASVGWPHRATTKSHRRTPHLTLSSRHSPFLPSG